MTHHTQRRLWILFVAVLLCRAAAYAEETPTREFDRFDIRFGAGWVFDANTEATVLGSRGFGTTIDFDKTLGGDQTDSLFRVDAGWRWADKHSLNFSWYDVNRTGSKVLAEQVEFGNRTFDVGAGVDSELNISLYRLLYRYGLARTDAIDFDLGAGLYIASIKAGLTATTSFGSTTVGTHEETALTAPLPTVGFLVNCKLTKKLSLLFSADWFYFKYQDWKGSQSDLQTGLEYHFARHWTLGVAYDHLNINFEGPVDPGHFSVRNGWSSLYSYIALHW